MKKDKRDKKHKKRPKPEPVILDTPTITPDETPVNSSPDYTLTPSSSEIGQNQTTKFKSNKKKRDKKKKSRRVDDIL
jgi:hypothetical protein